MKSLIVFSALMFPFFCSFAAVETAGSNTTIVSGLGDSKNSGSDVPSLDINAGSISDSTLKNQSSMLFYLIPAGAALLGIICLIALSKKLLFEKP